MLDKMLEIVKENKITAALAGLGLMIGAAFVLFNQPTQAEQVPSVTALASQVNSTSDSSAEETPLPSKEEEESKTIMVDVKGAVQKPGLYKLEAGSRLADAVAEAGGLSEEADSKSINLAQKLSDEAVVYVAKQGEEVSVVQSSAATGTSSTSQSGNDLVNINTATLAELQTISGIGAKRAQDIIDYREANGGFKTIDDLNNVSGIGDKTMENLRAYVTVD
ncbi:helix-hairpin-helix domain-containing protein [Streptococcus merionis]|uniref:DNA uptake protein and related DNA-binding proteins n=1 Tax=Streptococcus merionis TaxID=400065 RepID=A0A239SNK9_9STRE|nr:helix-hairpin-helix domain-containing protein [Streptococcus merionis]SNU87041.1 DNA uptake protein and related DNA-binding proteins [Streptococcus merionis]